MYSITVLSGNRDDINLYTVIISVGHTSSNFQPHRKWNRKPKHLAILAHGARFIIPQRQADTFVWMLIKKQWRTFLRCFWAIRKHGPTQSHITEMVEAQVLYQDCSWHFLHLYTSMIAHLPNYCFYSQANVLLLKTETWKPSLICMVYSNIHTCLTFIKGPKC